MSEPATNKPKRSPFENPGIGFSGKDNNIDNIYAEDRANRVIDYLEKYTQITGKKVLDIGSGRGDLILPVYQRGGICYALEPDIGELNISKKRFDHLQADIYLTKGQGEKLPFGDRVFDIVLCHQILEHTDSPKAVVNEAVRALKPGGYLYLTCPNYLFPYEFHYKVPWLPYFPKKLAGIYLKVLGKSPVFLNEHIFYINTIMIERMVRRSGLKVQATSYKEIVTNIYLKPKRRRIVNKLLRSLIFLHVPNCIVGVLSPNVTIVARKQTA